MKLIFQTIEFIYRFICISINEASFAALQMSGFFNGINYTDLMQINSNFMSVLLKSINIETKFLYLTWIVCYMSPNKQKKHRNYCIYILYIIHIPRNQAQLILYRVSASPSLPTFGLLVYFLFLLWKMPKNNWKTDRTQDARACVCVSVWSCKMCCLRILTHWPGPQARLLGLCIKRCLSVTPERREEGEMRSDTMRSMALNVGALC